MKNIIIFEIKHSNNNCLISTCKLSIVKFAEGNSGCRSCRSISCSTGLAHGNYVPRPAWRLHRALLFLRNSKQCQHVKLSSVLQLRTAEAEPSLSSACQGYLPRKWQNGDMNWDHLSTDFAFSQSAIWTGGVLPYAHSLPP